MIHGCVGPLFFTYCVLLATFTSRRWTEPPRSHAYKSARQLLPLVAVTTLVAYGQLVLGAQLRHTGAAVTPAAFRALVMFHLLGAAILVVLSIYLAVYMRFAEGADRWLRVPANCLVSLVLLQAALGGGAWLVNYGWPAWLSDYSWAQTLVINAQGSLQANITTAHVATGSLILGTAAMISLRAFRTVQSGRCSYFGSLVAREAAA
jgi:cytochrome c oxidase assembly protein subunit 15